MSDSDPAAWLRQMDIWPSVEIFVKLGLAVAVGSFVGLEREHRGKVGVRTFALTALLGALSGLLGGLFAPFAMLFVTLLAALMNWREMMEKRRLALTTSVALAVVGMAGVMCGQGHVFTPVAAGIVTAALLAWKDPISGFAGALEGPEIRSAILLAILACVIYPVLPERAVDPWGLIDPRDNWIAVIAIAAIGFVNYILLKVLGPRGMEITAFFGGLINSRKVIIELMGRARAAGPDLEATARKGVVLATASMLLRNALIVALFAVAALPRCAPPFGMMLVASALLWWHASARRVSGPPPTIALESPFSLIAALKFGLVFLALNVLGILANRHLGAASFYVVSVLGGLLSSASSITSAATLIGGHKVPVATGANGIILSSITSVVTNIPLVRTMSSSATLRRDAVWGLVLVATGGLVGAAGEAVWMRLR